MKNLINFFIFAILLAIPRYAYASPYFYLEGLQTVYGNNHDVYLHLYSDTAITAAQTVVSFDTAYISPLSITKSSICFASPASPSLGYGSQATPYFYSGDRMVISCGFSNPGYTSTDADGDVLSIMSFSTDASGSASFTFDASATKFYYIGSAVSSGAMSNEDLVISPYIAAIPAATDDQGATLTLTEDDITFTEIGASSGTSVSTVSNSSSTSDSTLSVIEDDDTIPPPPDDLPQRALPTPLAISLLDNSTEEKESEEEGEVLSAKSLRELLIPGKSTADKTVVLVNFISVLVFLFVLAILVWKFISMKRVSKIKSRHMSELLMGELATIESKLGGSENKNISDSVKSDIGDTIKKVSKEIKEEGS